MKIILPRKASLGFLALILLFLPGQSLCPCLLIPNVAGIYEPLPQSRCTPDPEMPALDISQNCHILHMQGGFAAANGETFSGVINQDGLVNFAIGSGTCTGVIVSSAFTGTCTLPQETCAFAFCRGQGCAAGIE